MGWNKLTPADSIRHPQQLTIAQHVHRAPRYIRPHLEALEDRLVLDGLAFAGLAFNGDGFSWNDPRNWMNLATGLQGHVPGASDDAFIGAAFGVVIPSGYAAEVNSLSTAAGGSLTVSGGSPNVAELKIDGYYPLNPPPNYPSLPLPAPITSAALSLTPDA